MALASGGSFVYWIRLPIVKFIRAGRLARMNCCTFHAMSDSVIPTEKRGAIAVHVIPIHAGVTVIHGALSAIGAHCMIRG